MVIRGMAVAPSNDYVGQWALRMETEGGGGKGEEKQYGQVFAFF